MLSHFRTAKASEGSGIHCREWSSHAALPHSIRLQALNRLTRQELSLFVVTPLEGKSVERNGSSSATPVRDPYPAEPRPFLLSPPDPPALSPPRQFLFISRFFDAFFTVCHQFFCNYLQKPTGGGTVRLCDQVVESRSDSLS